MCPEDISEDSSDETDQTSEVDTSDSQTDSQEAEKQEALPEKKTDESNVPFHEHPRFKELIDERRAFKEQLDQAKGYMEAMQRELQAVRTQTAPRAVPEVSKYKSLIDQMRAVNPEFAQFQEELVTKLESFQKKAEASEKLQARLDSFEQQNFATSAVSKLSNLLESNKIPEALRKRYDREVRAMAYEEEAQGKKLSLNDVDRFFKAVHEDYTPFLENIKRETLKGYVKEKVGDKTPAATTGGAPIIPGKNKIKAGDEESLVKWMAGELRAAKKL